MRIRFNQTNSSNIIQEQSLLKRIENIQMKNKIQRFAAFLPDEVLQLHGLFYQMHQVHHFVGVLLRVDISGILEIYDHYYKGGVGELYIISLNVNAYIGSIIEVIRCYGGDVLTIAQNDFLALWKVEPEKSMFEILHTVVVCAHVIQQLLGTYEDEFNVPIKLKTAVSCGNVSLGLAGNNSVKRVVIISDIFDSLRTASHASDFGEVVVTTNSWPHMLQERYSIIMTEGYIRIVKIIYKSSDAHKKVYFDEIFVAVVDLIEKHWKHRNLLRNILTSRKVLTSYKILFRFEKSLPQREEIKSAPRYWNTDDVKPLLNEAVFMQIVESQPVEYLTELRKVTVLFIKVASKQTARKSLMSIVHLSLNVILDNIKNVAITITNLYVVENEIMITIIFGLALINHENESLQALKFGYKIKILLERTDNIMQVAAGVTSGVVYCSIIGHPLRREYVVVGRAILKANRLTTEFPDQVTCDYQIFDTSKLSSLYFKLNVEEESLNGNKDFIFEFNENFDFTEPKIRLKPLIDRVSDFNLIVGMIQNPKIVGFSGICLEGQEMIGKSMILSHVYEHSKTSNYLVVSLSLTHASQQPYFCISELYARIYDQVHTTYMLFEKIIDLPRKLVVFSKIRDFEEDIGLQKYRTLNYFRDMVQVANRTIVLFIDNIEYIDQQSWEIIELTFPFDNIRLVMAGRPSKPQWDLRLKIILNHNIRLKEVMPLKKRYIVPLACTMINVQAVSTNLVSKLEKTCEGIPGYVERILLNLINNETLELKFCTKQQLKQDQYSYMDLESTMKIETMFPVLDFSGKQIIKADKLTLDLIYFDLFDSFTPFQQLVMKAASAMGITFGRTLLIIALNYPQGDLLSKTICVLFEEKIFACASQFITSKHPKNVEVCCRCYFEEEFVSNEQAFPKYAHCKHMRFRNELFQTVSYKRIPDNHRVELHLLYTEVLEKMEHICPNCVRNPSNFYSFFGKYNKFLEFCQDPSIVPDYLEYKTYSNEDIKDTLRLALKKPTSKLKEIEKVMIAVIDEKYIPLRRYYDPSSCQCLEMLYVVYKDLIYHAIAANESGKTIFYTFKLGLIQLCMRDILTAITTFQETRELSLVNIRTEHSDVNHTFRQYHIGKASVALAVCYMRLRNVKIAKHNIMIALRQYHIPSLAFTFKHFRFLLKRPHISFKTLKPYNRQKSAFAWELGIAMIVCAKIFVLENNYAYAKDCCHYGLSLMRSINNNMSVLMDVYCDAIDIYRKSHDEETCERLQKRLIHDFHINFCRNDMLCLNTLPDFFYVIIDKHIFDAQITKAIRVGYRLMNLEFYKNFFSKNPNLLLLLCELNIYSLNFRDFIDMFSMLTKHLSSSHNKGYMYHYLMCVFCYHLTGFHIIPFEDIVKYATKYFQTQTVLTHTDVAFKLLIEIQYLRGGRYERSKLWSHFYDYKDEPLSYSGAIKIMLYTMEGYLLHMVHNLKMFEELNQAILEPKIITLFELLKAAVSHNLMYKPAYLGFLAWYMMLNKETKKGLTLIKKVYRLAKKTGIGYYMALALRMQNYWKGGFLLDFETRPQISIQQSPTYTFDQFTQFMHPFVLD